MAWEQFLEWPSNDNGWRHIKFDFNVQVLLRRNHSVSWKSCLSRKAFVLLLILCAMYFWIGPGGEVPGAGLGQSAPWPGNANEDHGPSTPDTGTFHFWIWIPLMRIHSAELSHMSYLDSCVLALCWYQSLAVQCINRIVLYKYHELKSSLGSIWSDNVTA